MTMLQWALLVLGAAAVIAVYVVSRRGSRVAKLESAPESIETHTRSTPRPPTADQLEMFKGSGEFDEFGVGRPRKRTPMMTPPPPAQATPAPLFTGSASAPSTTPASPATPATPPPPSTRTEPTLASPKKKKGKRSGEEKIITLLIAEREGTAIFGPKIHAALTRQNLKFGDKRIYHRLEGDEPVFSVASLVKPGHLDPAEQQLFSTPGLSVFMLLPGPAQPRDAVRDMIATAQALAESLNAQVFDAQRQPFTELSASELVDDVEAWASRNFI